MATGGEIEDADKVYLFQAQLKLIQLLLPTQQINNFSSIRFYQLSPFDVVPDAQPALALDVGQETIIISQFGRKGRTGRSRLFSIPAEEFAPPAPNYFGISSAYSFPADDFYRENNFRPLENLENERPSYAGLEQIEGSWRTIREPQSEIVVQEQVPVLQTWYPVHVTVAHPETWEEALVPVGIVQIIQRLDQRTVGLLAEQFGLDIGLARSNELLITSLDRTGALGPGSTDTGQDVASAAELPAIGNPAILLDTGNETLILNENAFNYAWESVHFKGTGANNGANNNGANDNGGTRANLQAVVFSPVSELAGLTGTLRRQIVQLAIVTVLLAGVLIYLSLLYLLNKPLGALMDGVQRISRGDLNHAVTTGSADEVGQLAVAFNGMASQLRELIASLEQRVADRTRELTEANDAAEKARQRAERANQAKSEFLSHMSHELRTPLNGILGYTQILRKQHTQMMHSRELDISSANRGVANGVNINNNDAERRSLSYALDRQIHGLNIIQQSGQHLLTLINDILDMAKIEAQKMELVPSDIELSDFLESLVNIFRFRAEQKGLRFFYEPPGNLPHTIHVDEKRLRQIIINLLSNAIRYTNQGEVVFRVNFAQIDQTEIGPRHIRVSGSELINGPEQLPETRANLDQTVMLQFEIEDTGVGMTQQEISEIFSPFEQSGDLAQRDKGTGLGLAISQNLARMMGSRIQVQSSLGDGSTFWFELTVRGNLGEKPQPTKLEKTICGYRGPQHTILTVDDNQHNRSLIRDLLEPLGFRTIEARNGTEAIGLASEFAPDLVLMDLRMAGVNGLDATRLMRSQMDDTQSANGQPMIIIAASASAFESDRADSLQAGCDGFLTKPVQTAELFELLKDHLRIEWIYEDEVSNELSDGVEDCVIDRGSNKVATDNTQDTSDFIRPSTEELAELLALAQSGMMRGIREKAAALAEQNPRHKRFADELIMLARNFREKELLALLQERVTTQ
ncbi:MAG: ATP-binding protein [Chloroflexota bacterium]